MSEKRRKKYFLSQQEIVEESARANELARQGILKDHQIPDQWIVSGVSQFKKQTNLILAITLGIFAIDRFYLKKNISACIKLFFIVIVTPVFLYVAIGTSLYKDYPDIVIVFSILFHGTSLGFYLGDIIIGCYKPRDYQFKALT